MSREEKLMWTLLTNEALPHMSKASYVKTFAIAVVSIVVTLFLFPEHVWIS